MRPPSGSHRVTTHHRALIFGDLASPGGRGLDRDCKGLCKPLVQVQAGLTTPRHVVKFILESRVSRLMVAGNRESRDPGIGERVERFMMVVFKALGLAPGEIIPGSRALAPGLMISRAVSRCDRRQAVTAQPHPVGSPVATGGARVLTPES